MKAMRSALRDIKQRQLWLYINLRDYALDKGLIAGRSDYVRFIILGRSRTGSTFLRRLLNSHHQITAFGEIFANQASIIWGIPGYRQSRRHLSWIQENPIEFLEKQIFRKFPARMSAVGFKIFYYHAQSEAWRDVWTYLKDHKDIRIIHMKRRNILKTHLSRKRAGLTKIWESDKRRGLMSIEKYNEPILLDYEECLEDFIRTKDWEKKYNAFFEDHAMIEIEYEDLANNIKEETKRILDFLEVGQKGLKPATEKQSTLSLSKAITNYAELKEKFIDTPWFEFFED